MSNLDSEIVGNSFILCMCVFHYTATHTFSSLWMAYITYTLSWKLSW